LASKIRYLQQHPSEILKLGRRAKLIAEDYRSERVYAEIVQGLTSAGSIGSNVNPRGRCEINNA
jgi:hypothetical protein